MDDDEGQPDLFGGVTRAAPAYEPKPEHVRNRLIDMLEQMRAAEHWPWEGTQLDLFRNTVWPYLIRLLPEEESSRWRAELETEAARLDLAA
jgi:hypothetical protein